MAHPFGPHRDRSIIKGFMQVRTDLHPNPTPLRKRQEYKDIAIPLGEAICKLSKISGDHSTRYQEEMEVCQDVSYLAFKLMKYIEDNAWQKPGE